MEYRITTRNEKETIQIAQNLESEKFENMIICLDGDLGSGKTIFAKGVAQALGINENITSPTFNIIKEYTSGELPLYHMDVYRLEDNHESVGLTDYFNKNGVCIIEWSDMISDILPENRLEIIFKVMDEETRIIKLIPYGKEYEDIVNYIL